MQGKVYPEYLKLWCKGNSVDVYAEGAMPGNCSRSRNNSKLNYTPMASFKRGLMLLYGYNLI